MSGIAIVTGGGEDILLAESARPRIGSDPLVFLASDAAAYITGQSLMVTGGGFML